MFRAGIICVALMGIAIVVLYRPRAPQELPGEIADRRSVPLVPSPANHRDTGKTIVERIETDPTIARRLAVPTTKPKWEQIDDEQLSQELAKAGRPAGLAKIGGQVTLIFHAH